MAIEKYCDGAVLDHTQPKHGTCSDCGTVTNRRVKGPLDTAYRFECDECDPATTWQPFYAEHR